MLRTLRIRDLLIIEDVTVDFGAGLNLLTGETGAGKSILVDALGLVAGARADRSVVRSGADKAVVEALFDVSGELQTWLVDHGLGGIAEGQLVVRREVPADGAGRTFICGSPSTVGLLRELGELLVELHGQHEQRSLLRPERQLDVLDGFGGHGSLAARVAGSFAEVDGARRRLDELRVELARRADRMEDLRRTQREIDAVRPEPGEVERLERERRLLRNAGRLTELLQEVVVLTYEGDTTAASLAAAAAGRAEELARLDPSLEELATRCRSAALDLEDAGAAFRDYRDRIGFEPGRLEAVESRLAAIERLCLRHGVDEKGLAELQDDAGREIRSLEGAEQRMKEAEGAVQEAAEVYRTACRRLGRARSSAAGKLAPAVVAQLGALSLGKAEFRARLPAARGVVLCEIGGEALPLHPRGAERAEFLLAANPGEPLRPLAQAASGGELSRVMLALHVVADRSATGRVLVFDEVDAGVGGAVADAVGERLARLAGAQQVLCVTHLPQVAAYAHRHFRVHKRVSNGRTQAGIDALSDEERIEELARMLDGRRPTATSRRHAAELLDEAGRGRAARPRRGKREANRGLSRHV